MLSPGFGRAVLGFIAGSIIGAIVYLLIRALVGLDMATASGPTIVFAGFGGLFGWLWGAGSFSPYSHEHNGFEHLREQANGRPSRLTTLRQAAIKNAPEVMRSIRPLIQPLLIALGICVFVVIVFMILGMIPLFNKPQTYNPAASVVTPDGMIMLPFGPVNKTVFFAILVFLVMGALGTMAVVLALAMSVLSNQVNTAKKMPNAPPEREPILFRVIDFFVTWLGDLLEGAKRSVTR